MSLVYLAGSLLGVAAIVGLAAFLFGWRDRAMDAQDAADLLAREVPGFLAGRTGHDARAALIENVRDGQVYLALVRGDGLVTRKLPKDLRVARDGARLTLDLRDFTLGPARLDLADAEYWEARLTGLAA